jgi:hypothetical protein
MMTYPLVTTGLLARTPKTLLSFCWAERYNDAFSKLETWKAFKRGLRNDEVPFSEFGRLSEEGLE